MTERPERREYDVTLGEVIRRLDDIAKSVAALISEVQSTYVRRDVYEAFRGADLELIRDLRADVEAIQEKQRWNWRLIAGVAASIGGTVVATLLIVKFGIHK